MGWMLDVSTRMGSDEAGALDAGWLWRTATVLDSLWLSLLGASFIAFGVMSCYVSAKPRPAAKARRLAPGRDTVNRYHKRAAQPQRGVEPEPQAAPAPKPQPKPAPVTAKAKKTPKPSATKQPSTAEKAKAAAARWIRWQASSNRSVPVA